MVLTYVLNSVELSSYSTSTSGSRKYEIVTSNRSLNSTTAFAIMLQNLKSPMVLRHSSDHTSAQFPLRFTWGHIPFSQFLSYVIKSLSSLALVKGIVGHGGKGSSDARVYDGFTTSVCSGA